jgi:hypothetical protein
LFEALVNSLHKLIRFYETVFRQVFRIIVACWLGRFHLIEGHALLDHVLNPVANNDDHVAVFHHVGFVTDPPVARNHLGAAILRFSRNRQIQDVIQRGDLTFDAATALQLDEWITIGSENITRTYDI